METVEPAIVEKPKGQWRQSLTVIASVAAYMIPLFWLWQKTDFPNSFGIYITAHGKAGLLESWYYSYLLIQRHQFWDVVCFFYMWAAVLWLIGYIARAIWRAHKAKAAAANQVTSSEKMPPSAT